MLDRDMSETTIDDYITQAWARCVEQYRLNPGSMPEMQRLDANSFRRRIEECHLLVDIARTGMARVNKEILHWANELLIPFPSCTLLLLDADGVALHVTGTECQKGGGHTQDLAMEEGFIWQEEYVGVTGPSLCLHDKKPRLVHRSEHLFRNFEKMVCCAVPVVAPSGALLGVIDLTCSHSSHEKMLYLLVMPLLTRLARWIEMQYFARSFQEHVILSLNSMNNSIEFNAEALCAVNENGVIIAAEPALTKHAFTGIGKSLIGANIRDAFKMSLDEALDEHHRAVRSRYKPQCRNAGREYDLRVFALPDNVPFSIVIDGILRDNLCSADEAAVQIGDALSVLTSSDRLISENIHRVRKVLNKDVSILLLGETGTGKDTFAHAVHCSSQRRNNPFVAINCAAIPESLIESELFGYEAGTFTGASRTGKSGKIMAANGGTLFLDEIGDMPASLQGRLLRVLEEREVTPLGAAKGIPVDIQLITATNKGLDDLVQLGAFRSDLLYRINGIVLSLPSLRERSDKVQLIEAIYQQECGAKKVRISAEAWHALLNYPWPGNIRELHSVIRTALALSDDNFIKCEELPARLVSYIESQDLAASPTTSDPLSEQDRLEKERILSALEHHRWRVINTARYLGVSRNTLYRKMHLYGIITSHTS